MTQAFATYGEDSATETARMLPCPSCGEKDVDATFSLGQKPGSEERYVNAGCMVCGMMGPDSHTAKAAADRWNALPRHAGVSETAAPVAWQAKHPGDYEWFQTTKEVFDGKLHGAYEYRELYAAPVSVPSATGPTTEEAEQLSAQLAGCSVAALGGTQNPAKRGDYGWSRSYQDVLDLRIKYERLLEIEHLAWHVLDGSEEDAATGNINITPNDDYLKLSDLLPEEHP